MLNTFNNLCSVLYSSVSFEAPVCAVFRANKQEELVELAAVALELNNFDTSDLEIQATPRK